MRKKDIYKSMTLGNFAQMMWADEEFDDEIFSWGARALSYEVYRELVFGNISFDDVGGGLLHKDLVPVMRR